MARGPPSSPSMRISLPLGRNHASLVGSALHDTCTGETSKDFAAAGASTPARGSRRDLAVSASQGTGALTRTREDFKHGPATKPGCASASPSSSSTTTTARRWRSSSIHPARTARCSSAPAIPATRSSLSLLGRGRAVRQGHRRPEDRRSPSPQGDLFGELSLLDEGSRTATARRRSRHGELLDARPRRPALLFKKRPDAALDMLAAMGGDDPQGRRAAAHARVAQRQRGDRGDAHACSASPTGSPSSRGSITFLVIHVAGSSRSGSASTRSASACRVRPVSRSVC